MTLHQQNVETFGKHHDRAISNGRRFYMTWFGGYSCIIPLILFFSGCFLFAGCEQKDLLGQGIIVFGLESNPTNLDPRFSTDAASSRIDELLFSTLFRKNANGEQIRDLVSEWDQPDITTYRFRIRKGVRFHDGRPLDARDVQYTYESLLNPALASPMRGSYEMISSVECPEPYTVVFRLREPFASFLVNLDLGIMPRPDSEKIPDEPQKLLVGSGPFQFDSWDRGSEIRLKANPDYYEGPPRIQAVHFKIVPDNTVRILELKKGTIHILQNEIEPEVLRNLEKEPGFSIQKRQGTNYSYMGFNLRDPILSKLEVRKAIAHAIDRDSIIRHLLGSMALPATGVLSPLIWAYEQNVKTFAYDPEKAKQLLDQAGYPDPDGDGPETRFSLSYKTSQNELRRRIGETIQSQLNDIGIGFKIRSYEWGTFYSDIQKGNFQTYTLTWVGITDPDIYYYLFHSQNIPPNGANRGYYRNAEVDRLLEKGRVTQEKEARKEIYGWIQKILAEDLVYVSLWYSVNVVVMDRRIQGFTLCPDGDLISLKDVWIE